MSDGLGLSKSARLEAERIEREAAGNPAEPVEVEPLNPPWPWRVEGFDPEFWRLNDGGKNVQAVQAGS